MSSLKRKAGQVHKYLVIVRPKIEPGRPPTDKPMNRKERGGPRSPVSESAEALMELNARAASVLDPLIENLKKTSTELAGHSCADMLYAVELHPGCERSWPEKKREAFFGTCLLIASAARAKGEAGEFEVFASVSGVEGVGEGQPETKREGWRIGVDDAKRIRYARMRGYEESGMSRAEAKKKVAHDLDVSPRTLDRDVLFVEGDEGAA